MTTAIVHTAGKTGISARSNRRDSAFLGEYRAFLKEAVVTLESEALLSRHYRFEPAIGLHFQIRAGLLKRVTQMKQLSFSEWLVVQPALSKLADHLRNGIAMVSEIEVGIEEIRRGNHPQKEEPSKSRQLSGPSVRAVEIPNPRRHYYTLMEGPFKEAYEMLCKHGCNAEAENILELYDESIENAGRTLQYVEALKSDLAPKTEHNETDEGLANTPEPDGPMKPDTFCWQGEIYRGLQPIPWRLVSELWYAQNKTYDFDELATEVWEVTSAASVADNAMRSAKNKATAFFRQHKIPFRVQTKGRYVSLVRV